MALNINSNFHINAALNITDRDVLSLSQFPLVNDNIWPDMQITLCSTDGKIYIYNKTNDLDPVYGRFKVVESGLDTAIQFVALPSASEELKDSIYQYIGVNTDDYKNGYWYKCVESVDDETGDKSYSWENIFIQPPISMKELKDGDEGYTEGLRTYVFKQGDVEIGKLEVELEKVLTGGNVYTISKSKENPDDADEPWTFTIEETGETYTEADTEDEESPFFKYPTIESTFIGIDIQNQDTKIFIDAKKIVSDDINKVQEKITANVEVGGVLVGDEITTDMTITEALKKILIKYFAPVATLVGTGSKVLKKGTTATVSLTASSTKKSEPITSFKIYKGDDLLHEEVTDIADGSSYNVENEEITEDTTYKLSVGDGRSVSDATVKYEFVTPFYYGAKPTPDSENLDGLTELVEKKGDKTIKVTADNLYIYIMYPAAYGDMSALKDANNLENLTSGQVDNVEIDGVNFKRWVSNNKVTCSDFTYIIKF